jgi:hypothetical protein
MAFRKRKIPTGVGVDVDSLVDLGDLTIESSQETYHEESPKRHKFSGDDSDDDESQTPMDLDTGNILADKPTPIKYRSIFQMLFAEEVLGDILRQFLGSPEDIALRLLATQENKNYLLDIFAQENGWFGDPTSSQLIKSSVSFLGNFDEICNKSFCPELPYLFVELELLKNLFRLWNPGYDHTEDHTGMRLYVSIRSVVICAGFITKKISPSTTSAHNFINFELDEIVSKRKSGITVSVLIGNLLQLHILGPKFQQCSPYPSIINDVDFFITN